MALQDSEPGSHRLFRDLSPDTFLSDKLTVSYHCCRLELAGILLLARQYAGALRIAERSLAAIEPLARTPVIPFPVQA